MPETFDTPELVQRLRALRADAAQAAGAAPDDPRADDQANLLAWLALRRRDLTGLQFELERRGLAPLDRAAARVLETLDALLARLEGQADPAAIDLAAIHARRKRSADTLFGPPPDDREVRIMVTLPNEAPEDSLPFQDLLKAGMDCARINCAYGDPETWSAIIERLDEARQVTGLTCRLFMDLRGPKLRTGPMQTEPSVIKIRPLRSRDGQVLRPARIWLTPSSAPAPERAAADATLVVDAGWLAPARAGDRIRLRDARGSGRKWRVVECRPNGCWAETRRTTYVANGLALELGTPGDRGKETSTLLDSLPPRETEVAIRAGDHLYLDLGDAPGRPSVHDLQGELLRPARIPLAVPEVFRDVRVGEPVGFDDGHVRGVVEAVEEQAIRLRVTHTRRPLETLGSNKGINLPETRLDLPALGEDDLRDLPFVAARADLVGLSFTNRAEDVRSLHRRLAELGRPELGIVLKIETRQGCRNLPEILREALALPAAGLMIARGDLAAECGFLALARLQEELLELCAAARLPVVWATGVMDRLARTGHPVRAEITDAAAAGRAQCVLLGKGRHVAEAVRAVQRLLREAPPRDTRGRRLLQPLSLLD